MILHIPHSSIYIPEGTIKYTKEDLECTDFFTDKIFWHKSAYQIIFNISRIVCDVERFPDDNSIYGVCYKTVKRLKPCEEIMKKYYYPHHQRLISEILRQKTLLPRVLIVDGHSFDKNSHGIQGTKALPDICLGYNSHNNDKKLIQTIKKKFISLGYTVRLNYPFSGSMIPLEFKNDKQVFTLMIEINKNIISPKIKEDISKILDICEEFENDNF